MASDPSTSPFFITLSISTPSLIYLGCILVSALSFSVFPLFNSSPLSVIHPSFLFYSYLSPFLFFPLLIYSSLSCCSSLSPFLFSLLLYFPSLLFYSSLSRFLFFPFSFSILPSLPFSIPLAFSSSPYFLSLYHFFLILSS